MLKQFRKELPANVAAVSRPVATHGVWDAIRNGESHELLEEPKDGGAREWVAVDERTMESRQFSRMQRMAISSQGGKTGESGQTGQLGRRDTISFQRVKSGRNKKHCALRDERGRVNVDFRAVGILSAFLSDNQKILPKRKSGLSAKGQRKLARAVKTARTMALLNPEPKPQLSYEEMVEMERMLEDRA